MANKEVETITFRVEPQIKEEAMRLCKDLGFDISGACTMFIKQMLRERALPFTPSMMEESK